MDPYGRDEYPIANVTKFPFRIHEDPTHVIRTSTSLEDEKILQQSMTHMWKSKDRIYECIRLRRRIIL